MSRSQNSLVGNDRDWCQFACRGHKQKNTLTPFLSIDPWRTVMFKGGVIGGLLTNSRGAGFVVITITYTSGVTILLSLTVFLNMVCETMPVTSDNPLLGDLLGYDTLPAQDYISGKSVKKINLGVLTNKIMFLIFFVFSFTY